MTSKYNEAANKRQQASDLKNCTRLPLKFTNSTDADILEWLEKQGAGKKQDAIKRLIRQAIASEQ